MKKRQVIGQSLRGPMDKATREWLRRQGRKGGKAASGAGAKKRWATVSAEERSRIMRAVRAGKRGKKK